MSNGPEIYIEDPVEREIYQNSADWTDIDARTRALKFKPEDIERYFVVRNFIHAAQSNVSEGIFDLLKGSIPLGLRYTIHMLGEDSDDDHSDTLDQRWCICYEIDLKKEISLLLIERLLLRILECRRCHIAPCLSGIDARNSDLLRILEKDIGINIAADGILKNYLLNFIEPVYGILSFETAGFVLGMDLIK